MYICKECKTEYKRKPQYCDCGNNTFETTHKEIVLDFSKIFLLFCILLSAIILIIPVKTNTNKTPEAKKHNITKNIPTLDSFWDNTVAQKPITKTEKKVVQKTETMVTTPIAKSTPKQKTTKQTITKKTNTTNKTVTKKQNTNNTNKANNPQNTSHQAPTPQKNTTQNTTPKVTQSTTNTQTVTPKKIAQTTQNTKELYNYKLALRQALFSNLSITAIQGSGKCQVEFAIDKTGKLINRAFTYQSNNKSLNDEVYKMLMKMPKFYPPPKSYNGEKFKIYFEFNNGNFTINYTN